MEDEILQEFVVESTEALDQLDVELVALEDDPSSTATLSSIFRRVHTIKGTCGFLGFGKLEGVTHVGENLLSKLRDGELTATPEIVSTLLELVDAIREMMDQIVATGQEGDGDYGVLLATLTAHTEGATPPAADGDDGETAADATTEAAEDAKDAAAGSGPPPTRLGDILVETGKVSDDDIGRALRRQKEGDPRHLGEILVGWGIISPDDALAAIQTQQERTTPAAGSTASMADSSIRVDVELLDTLMNLVGELVLNRNQVLQHTRERGDAALDATLQRLDLITTELQGSVMQTRMQPIETAWAKYPRVVRDLARLCQKEVGLEMHGKETELDKTLLEAIKDPLTHIVRNAVDHGIEAPDVRAERGKPRKGTLRLHAFHESGQVIIEIADDGGGIDAERVCGLAIERGVITEARAATMSTREKTELIFAAGFSTAEQVSNISGRGVGMDVVRTNIEQIGGSVDLHSELGRGTTIRVKIPLTLAIIPALVVRSGDHDFAIPQVSLLELVRLSAPNAVEQVHGAPVHRLRGQLLPLVYLNQQLASEPVAPSGDHMVVLQSGERTFGLVVDSVQDTAEIVVKPLGKQLRELPVFAGATIMGDGQVALILDVVGLATAAGLSLEARDTAVAQEDEAAESVDVETLLLFSLAADQRYALPLSEVARLEEFAPGTVERSGAGDVVQYRDHILPLCHVADVLAPGLPRSATTDEPVRAIVYSGRGGDVGLVVGEIDDIVHEQLTVTAELDEPGLTGSAVIDGVVTDVVDIDGLLERLGVAPALAAPAQH